MKVIWKGDEERNRMLEWHGVLFAPGKETEIPADFPSMAKLVKNPAFKIVGEAPAPPVVSGERLHMPAESKAAHPGSAIGKSDKR